MNIQHSSHSDEWFTPPEIIKLVKRVLGPIDFDPASCLEANEIVQATHFWTELALEREWLGGSIYCNPPGGKTGNKSNMKLFWEKLLSSKFDHAIFMAFSIEALQTTQSCKYPMMYFPLCIPEKRIRFISPEGKKSSPSHSNCIVYVPGYKNETVLFRTTFANVGGFANVGLSVY